MDVLSQRLFKKLTLNGESFSQKMKALTSFVQKKMVELGIEPHCQIHFRGDVLEVLFKKETYLPDEFNREFDAYFSAGLMISLLRSAIHSCGYKTNLRTFPRFDEPDLVAFIYISKDKYTVPWFFESASSNGVEKSKTVRFSCLLNDISNRRMLIAEELNKTNDISDSEKKILISSSHNMPSTWLQSGFFAGDLTFNIKKSGFDVRQIEPFVNSVEIDANNLVDGLYPQFLMTVSPIS